MRVDEFVERFLPVLKVELHTIPHYARQCDTIGKRVETLCAQVIILFFLVAQVLPNSC